MQEYILKNDIICLTETKCDTIDENEIAGYKSFVMPRKSKRHKYGGIHGICVFMKEHIALHCCTITTLDSESTLWLSF